jgi:hypothetical protein
VILATLDNTGKGRKSAEVNFPAIQKQYFAPLTTLHAAPVLMISIDGLKSYQALDAIG